MAQSEDTELTDLVVEALEKNGSLAKIRALLRANIFLAFEDDCENVKQNETLDRILVQPEGQLCLSAIHEFLDFCNLKNTLFVYKSETRQGKEYVYDKNITAEKLNLSNQKDKEPLLLTLIKTYIKSQKTSCNHKDKRDEKIHTREKKYYIDEENSTYIINEDSSITTSHSHSDNSSDEKNKLDLRLPLDNSDTDTSSSSTRGKTSSEYIVNNLTKGNVPNINQNIPQMQPNLQTELQNSTYNNKINVTNNFVDDLKILNNSSDSTSYIELKPFNSRDSVLLNTTGLPLMEEKTDSKSKSPQNSTSSSKLASFSQIEEKTNSENKISLDIKQISKGSPINSQRESPQHDGDLTEYSYDFTSPSESAKKETLNKHTQSPRFLNEDTINKSKNSSTESHKQTTSPASSQSSVSLSDVQDLISERSSHKHSSNCSLQKLLSSNNIRCFSGNHQIKNVSDDSGDFSDSPIPSLSNLSLDIHSD